MRLTGLWPLALYLALVLALFVRFVDPDAPPRRHVAPRIVPAAQLRLVRWHHRLFYTLLAVAPLEWWWRGRPAGWGTLVGVGLFAAGIVGYRRAGRALGPQLSPLLAPSEPAAVVESGPYRRVRHPMYRAELAMACGAALSLASWLAGALAVALGALVLRRIAREEDLLAARLPAYRAYAARTTRLLPHVY